MATTALDIVGGDRSVVVARINGELRDLSTPVTDTDVVEAVTVDTPEGLAVLRHSAAHVLAQAVQDAFPDAKLGIGPPVKDGFYYDFDVETPFTPEDLVALEKRMVAIIKSGQRFQRRVVSEHEAVRELADEPYKLRLIGSEGGADVMEVGGAELTIYDNVDAKSGERCWGDLCRGPHVPDTRYIPQNAVKLMRTAAAYWLGDQRNEQLQRVYGTAWPSKDELRALPDLPRGGRAPRPSAAGRRARPVLVPRADRIRAGGLPPQGWRRPPRHGGLLAARARGGRLRVRQQPAHHQGRPVRAVRAPRLVRRGHVPARCSSTQRWTPTAWCASRASTTTSSR